MNTTPTLQKRPIKKESARTWALVRAAYISGEGSCEKLALRFNIPVATIRARSKREKWKFSAQYVDRKIVASATISSQRFAQSLIDGAEDSIRDSGRKLGDCAKALVERQIRESSEMLDALVPMRNSVAASPPRVGSVKDVGTLVAAWEKVIKTARLAHPQLDSPPPTTSSVNVGAVRSLVVQMTAAAPVALQDAPPSDWRDSGGSE